MDRDKLTRETRPFTRLTSIRRHADACSKWPRFLLRAEKLHGHDASVEPTPNFATNAEIKLAEQVRYQLEAVCAIC